MIVAIHQPNYIPWLGFFHKMASSDVFVLFDDAQLPRGKSFCSRTKIKTDKGEIWLTVPIKGKGELKEIKEIKIVLENNWQRKHWKSINMAYSKSSCFNKYEEHFQNIYNKNWKSLLELNFGLITLIKFIMGIKTKLVLSSDITNCLHKSGLEKILGIVKSLNGDTYLTGKGKGTQRYINKDDFERNGIKLRYQNFQHPIYTQLYGEFIPNLSVIDLIFNCGDRSLNILLGE